MKHQPTVIGVGQTDYRSHHPDSTPALVQTAASRALAHAGYDIGDIDAVVFASAPDVFEGVHEPDRWLADALGAVGKPMLRIHTGGATGGSAAVAAAASIGAGQYESILVVGLQRTGEAKDAQQIFTTIFDPVFEQDVQLTVITSVAMQAAAALEQGRLTVEQMARVSIKNFGNALRNPHAHLRKELTVDEVLASPMLAWPIRRWNACPRSDGAAAVVMTTAERAADTKRPGAVVTGIGAAADVYRLGERIVEQGDKMSGRRALEWASAGAYRQAGITCPREELDVVEMYAPFPHTEILSYEAIGLAEAGKSAELVDEGAVEFDGDIPVCPSGGCQASNPIGASGLVRFAEAALQAMGEAGDHQIDGAQRALATATGGINQFFTCVVLEGAK
jgi:acetyl-CoA C-acetyltransferase